jgi:type IV secretion system protein TrbL
LAKGIGSVAKAKAASMRDSAMERIADTTGGKIAAAIKAQGGSGRSSTCPQARPAPTSATTAWLRVKRHADPESEVAAFVNRDGREQTA